MCLGERAKEIEKNIEFSKQRAESRKKDLGFWI